MKRHNWLVVPLIASLFLCSMTSSSMGHGPGGGGGGSGGGGGGFRGVGHGGGGNFGHGHAVYRNFGGHWGHPGHGWGRGYGWGLPVYGLGLGLGLGYGLGYSYGAYGGYGSPYYGYYGYAPYYAPAAVVMPYGAAGYGTVPYSPYSSSPSGSTPSGSTPSGTAPSGTSPSDKSPATNAPDGLPPSPATGADAVVSASAVKYDIPSPPAPDSQAVSTSGKEVVPQESTNEFARKAEKLFHSGQYTKAAHAWRHAVVDEPKEPRLLLLLGQALFASGRYDEAAGAVQAGMRLLPHEYWGSVIVRYPELYGRPNDYTEQLRALEKAVRGKPKDPALRFLLGYHYSFLGFHKEAVEQLDQALNASPRDEVAKALLKLTWESRVKSTVPAKP